MKVPVVMALSDFLRMSMGEQQPELSYIVIPEIPCSCDILVIVLIKKLEKTNGQVATFVTETG